MAEQTIFEQILSGDIPSERVYENDHVYAFRDINPQAPVHVLVIPKQKMESFADLKGSSAEEVGRFMQGVSETAAELGLEADGYRVVFNTGKHGQQTVQYLHAHIIGGKQLSWPPG
jgi:histidine triad (HIT) family protein